MNTATLICDTTQAITSCGIEARGKAPAEQLDDGPQQRFADVLPIAKAALAPASEKNNVEQTADKAESTETGKTMNKPERQDLSSQPGVDVPSWSFAEVIRPVPRQRAKGKVVGEAEPAKATNEGRTREVLAASGTAVQQVVTGDATPQRVISTRMNEGQAQPIPQGSSERPARAGKQAASTLPTHVSSKAEQRPAGAEHVGVRVRADATPATTVPAGQDSVRLAATVAKPAVSPSPVSHETSTGRSEQAGPAAPRNALPRQTGVKTERTPTFVASDAVHVAAQVKRQDAPTTVKPASQSQSSVAVQKTEQTTKLQANGATPAAQTVSTPKSEKNHGERGLSGDKQSNTPAKRAASTSVENPRTESAELGGKDVSVVGSKQMGTTTPDAPVTSIGGSNTFSHRLMVESQGQSQNAADAMAPRSPVQSVGEQILDSVQASAIRGDRQVVVRLQPPELGTVLVRFQEQGELVTGTLEVSSREARREIEQALPQVMRSLQEAGVQVRRLEVVASDQSERDWAREHLPQDAWSQQQGSGQGREQSNPSPQTRWPRTVGEPVTTSRESWSDEQRTLAAEGRIDLLL